MLFDLFKSKKKKSRLYTLINHDYDWQISTVVNFFIQEAKKIGITDAFMYDDFKYRTFKGSLKELKIKDGVELLSLTFFNGMESGNSDLYIDISIGKPKWFNCIIFEVSEDLTFDFEALITLINNLNIFQIEYGFSYSGRIGSYSQGYINGVIKNTVDLVDIKRKGDTDYNRWKSKHLEVKKGFIRDVFTENILTEDHLSMVSIRGKTLNELILLEPRFGSIKKIFTNYFWKVSQEDLEWVREQFKDQNFVI